MEQGPWYKAALAAAAAHVMVWTVLLRAGLDAGPAVGWGLVASLATLVLVGAYLRLQAASRDRQLEPVAPAADGGGRTEA